MKYKALLFLLFVLLVKTASAQNIPLNPLTTGIWRGVLKTSSGHNIPFNFEVSDTTKHQQVITIFNGSERFKVTDIVYEGDSVFVHMPLYDSEFRLKFSHNRLTGRWKKHLGGQDAYMDFIASPGVLWRFFRATQDPIFDVTGRWTAIFGDGTSKDTTVGVFNQTDVKLTGTFLTTTGDYRYLEGIVKDDSLYFSCFDGGHAYLFTAKLKDNHTLTGGKFYSGYSGVSDWTAFKNDSAKLPDAYSLTYLKPDSTKLNFSFPDINGIKVSLSDKRFKNKVVIVQLLGSWCPNCMDETNYFASRYYNKYHSKGVEVIGLAYERSRDFTEAQRTLTQLKKHFNIPYPLLITGFTPAKGDPQKSLPMLADFMGFPTTIIIDRKGEVRKIHTGFSGPGTGSYYTDFIDEFERMTDALVAEKPPKKSKKPVEDKEKKDSGN